MTRHTFALSEAVYGIVPWREPRRCSHCGGAAEAGIVPVRSSAGPGWVRLTETVHCPACGTFTFTYHYRMARKGG